YSVQAQLSPFSALRLFGELTAGQRGAPNIYAPVEDRPFLNEQKGYRAGAEINVRGLSIGAAVLRSESDSSAVFGLPFDTTTTGIRTFGASSVDGWELNASVPLFLRGLTGYGMVTNWLSGELGLYLPSRQYRAGLQLHTTPLRSGNLELFGRIEAVHRGEMFVPTGLLPEDNTIDAYAQIRIIDVRIFGRFEDITGKNAQEVAGRELPGPRLFYGVKWQFWN
ncbi:MAG TPA: hypothetical protein VGD27_04495, partial [Longimicrobiales bacterium]